MKIALAIDHFHPAKGGAERSLERILHALQKRGHQLQLCAMSWGANELAQLECRKVPAPRFPRWRRDWAFAQRGAEALRELNPDLVLGVRHTLRMDVFLARGGFHPKTLEGNLRSSPTFWRKLAQKLSMKHRALLALEKQVFTRPSPPFVIAPSHLVKREGIELYDLSPERIEVVHTGVDLNRFSPAALEVRSRLRRELGVQHATAVLFAAHNFRLKGLPCLLEAWDRLPQDKFMLLIAGRGAIDPRHRRPNIRALGETSSLIELYQASDVLAHPTHYDPFSRVVIEAMACGLPVITSARNGASEILADGLEQFTLSAPGETALLAEHLARFQEDGFARHWSLAARRAAERFPEETFLNATADCIEREFAAQQRAKAAG